MLLVSDPPRGVNDEEQEDGVAASSNDKEGWDRLYHDYR